MNLYLKEKEKLNNLRRYIEDLKLIISYYKDVLF